MPSTLPSPQIETVKRGTTSPNIGRDHVPDLLPGIIHEVHTGIPEDFDTVKVFGLGMCDPPLYPNIVSTEQR
jgi:hypothetical protein